MHFQSQCRPWRAGRGQGGHGRGDNATIPRKASEVGACNDLEGHIFTIGSGNKGKVGDMLRASMEKMGTYIGTKFGDKAAQEWTSGKKIITPQPAYSQAVLTRHTARVEASKDRIELKLKELRTEESAIEAKLVSTPANQSLLKEMREVIDDIAKGRLSWPMRLILSSPRTRRFPTPMLGGLSEKLMRASKRAGVKSTPCCLASAPKYVWTR